MIKACRKQTYVSGFCCCCYFVCFCLINMALYKIITRIKKNGKYLKHLPSPQETSILECNSKMILWYRIITLIKDNHYYRHHVQATILWTLYLILKFHQVDTLIFPFSNVKLGDQRYRAVEPILIAPSPKSTLMYLCLWL